MPADAALAGEIPALRTRLATDKTYLALWKEGHDADRRLVLTAVSDLVAFGNLHLAVIDATKAARVFETVTTLGKLLARSGKLPEDFVANAKAQFARTKTQSHMGLWLPTENGKPPTDATALAMWFAPNDADYVRERMRALVGGPFPYREKAFSAKRPWLANVGDVATRLGALGAFNRQDCLDVHMKWSEKVLPDGRTAGACEAPDEPKESATAPAGDDVPVNAYRVAKSSAVATLREESLDRAMELVADGDRDAFARFLKTEPGVMMLTKGETVFLVDTSGFATKVKVRRKGDTREFWTFREAIEKL